MELSHLLALRSLALVPLLYSVNVSGSPKVGTLRVLQKALSPEDESQGLHLVNSPRGKVRNMNLQLHGPWPPSDTPQSPAKKNPNGSVINGRSGGGD